MSISILTSDSENSGTTFLRTGGDKSIKIKSNVAWTFGLLPLNDSNDITLVDTAETEIEEDEVEITLTGTGTTWENIEWINIIDDLGNEVKTITGQGTTYLNIRAAENFVGTDMYAVGFASAITDSNLCDFTVFKQYGQNRYRIYFNDDEDETPSEISYDTTTIDVVISSNTRCIVTIEELAGEEYSVGSGVTKTGIKSGQPVPDFEFKFLIPENKTENDIVYTLKAQSRDDETYVVFHTVIQKAENREILLSPSEQIIQSNETAFTINYVIKPSTMMVDLNIFKENTLIDTINGCNGEGSITYNCGKNPNKGSGNINYYISGYTSGDTWTSASGESIWVCTSNISHVIHSAETYYFELIYGNQVGTSVEISGVDGDSGGKYDVSVHTNYSYTDFTLSPNGNLINDCAIIPVSDDYFTVEFNVKINKDTAREGSIGVNGPMNGTIIIKQGGGTQPSYTFYWNYEGDAWNGDAGAFSDTGETKNVRYHSTYPGNLTFRNLGYDWITGYDNNGRFSVTVRANDTGSDRIGSFGVRYNGTDIGMCKVTQSRIPPEPSYIFVIDFYSKLFAYGTNMRSPVLKSVRITSDIVGGEQLNYYDEHINQEIPDGRYSEEVYNREAFNSFSFSSKEKVFTNCKVTFYWTNNNEEQEPIVIDLNGTGEVYLNPYIEPDSNYIHIPIQPYADTEFVGFACY